MTATSRYLLNENTPVGALDEYSGILKSTADANAAALEEAMIDAAELEVLAARRAALAATHLSWKSALRVRGEAREARDGAQEAARTLYRRFLKRATTASRNVEGCAALGVVVSGSPAPSAVKGADLAEAMAVLRDGLAAHQARLSRHGVNATTLAALDAARAALVQAVADRTAASAALGQASAARTKDRLALLAQIRLIESILLDELDDTAAAGLRSARKTCLPRYTRDPEEDETDEEDGDTAGDGGDEPLPAAG